MPSTQEHKQKNQEPEGPDPLDQLADVLEEFETHQERLRGLDPKEATLETVQQELNDTFMSLMSDSARHTFDALVEIREEMASMGEALDDLVDDDDEPEEPAESWLTNEDAELFASCLGWMKPVVEQSLEQAKAGGDEASEARQAAEALLALVSRATGRLEEIREADDEPDAEKKSNGKAS